MPTIIFNGKSYNRIEDMPVNERQAFEQMSKMFVDANGNGIPDFLEGDLVQNVMTAYTSSYVVNGKTYNDLNELPAEMRNKVRSAFDMMAKMGLVTETSPTSVPVENKQQAASQPFLSGQSPTAIEEESGRSTFSMILIGIVLCCAVVAATIAIFVFTNR